jgi:hypothetical protein
MNASQLTDYKRLQKIICDLRSEDKTGYYTKDNDLIPDTDNVYTLGDSNHRFHSLYVGPGTIYMGDAGQSEIGVNRCNVLLCKPGLAAPYIEFTNSNSPTETESIASGIHVYYNVACNDLWKRYPDGTLASFGTVRGETGPQGPEWIFSNSLIPTQLGLNIGSTAYNVSNLYLSNSLFLNTIPITAGGGFVSISGVPIATRTDITNGVSSLSSIVSYGLSTVAAQPHTGVSSLSSIVSYGLSTVYSPYGVSSLSSIVSYGLSTVYSPYGISSLSSIVSYGLSTVYSPYGVSSLSSIVSYGLSTVYSPYGISSLSSIVSYGLSTVAAQPHTGVSSLSSIVSYGLSTVYSPYGVSSLSSIVSYGLSTVYSPYGVSSLSSIVSYGLSTVYSPYGVSSLSSIVSYGLSTVYSPYGISSLSSIVSYGLSSVLGTGNSAGISSLSSIVSYGLSSVLGTGNSAGISSLSSIVSYGLSSVLGTGNATGISSLSSIVSYGLSSIINSNTLQPLMGRVLRVDQLYGNDDLAVANGNHYQIAFKTIGTAMAHAQAGECIYVLPGTYNEKIIFSNDVTLRGINTPSVKIQQLGCTVPTTLVTFAQNNRLEDVTLNLTSSNSNATPLIGIYMSNISDPITATKMRGIVVNVDNSAMTCNVATNVYGIYTTGNSSILPISSDDIERSTVNVTSSGPGAKRGIYNDGSNGFRVRNTNIFCKDNPAYPNTSNGTYFGIETNNANAFIFIKSSTSYGYAYVAGNTAADISQTLGTISLAGTDLPNRTGNGKGFTNSTAQPSITFSISGNPDNYFFTYLIPGTINSGGGNSRIANYYPVRCATISMIDQFAFQCQSITNTVAAHLFKNSILQSNFTLILSPGTTYTNRSNVSLTITKNDSYGVMLSNISGGDGNGFTPNDITFPLITVSFY